MKLTYREDVEEFGFELEKEHILTESQFEILETFCYDKLRQQVPVSSFDGPEAALISTKDLIMDLRKVC